MTVNHDSSTATVPSDTIINTKPSKLPAAGGNGTIIFTAVGLTVMAAAGIIIFMSRKKKRSLINRKQIERLRRKREGVLEDEPPFR